MDENVNSLRGQNHAENLCSKQNFEPIALPGETDKSTETVEIATPVSQKVVGQLETTCDLSVPPKAAHTCPQVLDVDPATWPSTRLLQGLRRHAENSTGQSRFSHGDIWRGNRAVPGNPGRGERLRGQSECSGWDVGEKIPGPNPLLVLVLAGGRDPTTGSRLGHVWKVWAHDLHHIHPGRGGWKFHFSIFRNLPR